MIPPFFQEAGTSAGVDENDGRYPDDTGVRVPSPAISHWDSDDEPVFPSEIEQGHIVIKHDVVEKLKVGDMTPTILTRVLIEVVWF